MLRAGIDSTWSPVEYVDADGRPQGISVAYLKPLEQGLEVRFELVPDLVLLDLAMPGVDGRLEIVSGAVGSRITLRLPLAALSRASGARAADEGTD